ncbi:MAG: hypothetical protein EA353_03765 [Puniceicoccaceae bacterium]|nr:MAG: hypothetical protein EA353_03765 [Puniceicoccaceae bacterium]
MFSPLAQLSATPEWVYLLGSIIIIGFFLMGGVWMGLQIWGRLKGEDAEPKHTPSIDAKISLAIDSSEARMSGHIGEARAQMKEANVRTTEKIDRIEHELHGRISGLRGELRADYKELEDKVTSAADRMQDTYTATVDRMSKLEADGQNTQRQAIATQQQLQRHIEKS